MEAKLFNDLKKLLKGAVAAGGDAARGAPFTKIMVKYANKKQQQTLLKEFDSLYSESRGKVIAKRKLAKSAEPDVPEEVAASKTIGVTLGGYGHEAGAKEAARNFEHPDVFQHQSALFPNPRTHSVKVAVVSTNPIEVKNVNPLYPWGVKLQLKVEGDPVKVETWINQFTNQIRLHSTS